MGLVRGARLVKSLTTEEYKTMVLVRKRSNNKKILGGDKFHFRNSLYSIVSYIYGNNYKSGQGFY